MKGEREREREPLTAQRPKLFFLYGGRGGGGRTDANARGASRLCDSDIRLAESAEGAHPKVVPKFCLKVVRAPGRNLVMVMFSITNMAWELWKEIQRLTL